MALASFPAVRARIPFAAMNFSTSSALSLVCLLLAAPPIHAQTIFYGESTTLGNGTAETWVEVDADGVPLRIGLTMTEDALTGLPSNARVMSLDFPEVAVDGLFKHIMFDWAPSGHPPSVYAGHPHFDFHFLMLTEAERLQIPSGVDETPIPPEYMPEDYIPVPGLGTYSFPRMGVHYVDEEAPELNGEPFTKTLIYGFSDGEMIFVEPMITVDYLETYPNDTLPIKQPEAYQKTGYYPTTYRIVYDDDRQAFDVFLTDLVLREGTTTSSEGPGAAPARADVLHPPYPNPVRNSAMVEYHLATPGYVTLTIHDVLGREVARLVDAVCPAGEHTAPWDGRDGSGRRLVAGVYVVRLRAGVAMQSRRLLIVR